MPPELDTLTFLGAPSNSQLRRTWKEEFLEQELESLCSTPPLVAWRHLPHQQTETTIEDETAELDQSVLETSFALHVEAITGVGEDDTIVTQLATQLPNFDFDMSTVLDLEDLEDMPILDKSGRTIAYSVLCAVLSMSGLKDVVTKAGHQTQVVVLTLGDSTKGHFEMAVWGSHAQYVQKFLRPLDVVLFHDFALSRFNGILGGTSKAFRSSFTLLYRTNRQSSMDDQFRPLLMQDLQSDRVRAVRDWIVAWVPRSTQPDDSQMND